MTLVAAVAEHLSRARRVVAFTGAGVSAESGVPTFRDAVTGLWARFRPEELATPEAFERDPKLVHEWYDWRRKLVASIEPNAAHRALVEIERRAARFTLITQNVDGLHARAGSRAVIELHGALARSKCSREGVVVSANECVEGSPPTCARCGAFVRPDVVWFGEMLPEAEWRRACTAAEECDVFLSIGTSGLVAPASMLPQLAHEAGAVVVVVNPDAQEVGFEGAISLRGRAGEVLPAIVERWTRRA